MFSCCTHPIPITITVCTLCHLVMYLAPDCPLKYCNLDIDGHRPNRCRHDKIIITTCNPPNHTHTPHVIVKRPFFVATPFKGIPCLLYFSKEKNETKTEEKSRNNNKTTKDKQFSLWNLTFNIMGGVDCWINHPFNPPPGHWHGDILSTERKKERGWARAPGYEINAQNKNDSCK